jgi:uncharacterized membrane protein
LDRSKIKHHLLDTTKVAAAGDIAFFVGGVLDMTNTGSKDINALTLGADGGTGTLTNAAQMSSTRGYSGAAVVEGRLYIVGGFAGGFGTPMSDVISYPITGAGALGTPRTETPLPVAMGAFAMTVR